MKQELSFAKIQFNNLLLKHTVPVFTLHNPRRQNSKVAFKQKTFSRSHPANNLAWKNCTQKKPHLQSSTNIYCTKQNVDQNQALETEPLGLTLHEKKQKWCFVPTEKKRPPILKASSLFLSFFKGLDLQPKHFI